jgi:hypothetical protein
MMKYEKIMTKIGGYWRKTIAARPALAMLTPIWKRIMLKQMLISPEDSQIAPIGTIEVDAALLQIADSQRHEQQPADEEPKESQLERRERRSGNLQGNFHRTKGYGCQNNT